MRQLNRHADRVGLAWRDELALDIHTHLEHIDCLEVLADREFHAGRPRLRALKELGRQVPLSVHSVALGLAACEPVADWRLQNVARLVGEIEPTHWSEHLAFVRAGGCEIGHLAAPPFTNATLEGLSANVEAARRLIGSVPHLENIATLVWPAGSVLSEEAFVTNAIRRTRAPLLLDLHNLYANAWNFGKDPFAALDALPLEHLASVHLSGGCRVRDAAGKERLIDDHVHDPPEVVFEMLALIAARCPQRLEVIIERDGAYPEFTQLRSQLERARRALENGRRVAAELAA